MAIDSHRLAPSIRSYGESRPLIGNMTREEARRELRAMASSLVAPNGKVVSGYLKLTGVGSDRRVVANHTGHGATGAAELIRALVKRAYGNTAQAQLDAYLRADKGVTQFAYKVGSLSFVKLVTTHDVDAKTEHANLANPRLGKARIHAVAAAPTVSPQQPAQNAVADVVLRPQLQSVDELRAALQSRVDRADHDQNKAGNQASDELFQRLENLSLLHEAFEERYPQHPVGQPAAIQPAADPDGAAAVRDDAAKESLPWTRAEFDAYWNQPSNTFRGDDARRWLIENSGLGAEYGLAAGGPKGSELDALFGRFSAMPRSLAKQELAGLETTMVLMAPDTKSQGVSAAGPQALPAGWADQLLGTLGMRRHPVPGDGHCLFSSLAHAEGGATRDEFLATPVKAAQTQRERLLAQLEKVTAEEAGRMASSATPFDQIKPPASNLQPADPQPAAAPRASDAARKAQLLASYEKLSFGLGSQLNAADGLKGWGEQFEIRLKAMELKKTIAVITPYGVDVLQPDGSALSVPLNALAELKRLRSAGVPFIVNDQGSHFDSTE